MCTPQFTEALIPSGIREDSAPQARVNRTGAVDREQTQGGKFGRLIRRKNDLAGTEADEKILRRSGLTKKQARQLAQFANTRGGLDAFESIASARAAFSRSGAFTDRALQPREVSQVSRVGRSGPINQNRVGVSDLIGLPLIRRRG